MKDDIDEKFMREAIKEAKKAYRKNEVPIGAVVVYNGKIIGRGYNQVEHRGNATAHAEIMAISSAVKKIGGWRLNDCTIYVTIEPCLMCFGAIMLSRISCLVYGAPEPNFGFINHITKMPAKVKIKSGLLSNECKDLLQRFFKKWRGGRVGRRHHLCLRRVEEQSDGLSFMQITQEPHPGQLGTKWRGGRVVDGA